MSPFADPWSLCQRLSRTLQDASQAVRMDHTGQSEGRAKREGLPHHQTQGWFHYWLSRWSSWSHCIEFYPPNVLFDSSYRDTSQLWLQFVYISSHNPFLCLCWSLPLSILNRHLPSHLPQNNTVIGQKTSRWGRGLWGGRRNSISISLGTLPVTPPCWRLPFRAA